MKKSVLLAAVLLIAVTPAFAQNGCVNSPENPTVILALVGSAGAFLASARSHFGRRK